MKLVFNFIMVETHTRPARRQSDAHQEATVQDQRSPRLSRAAALLLLMGAALGAEAGGEPIAVATPGAPPALVRGRVVDSTGSPVPGASVSLRRVADSFLVSGWSGKDGRFALEAPPGGFELSASAPGFSVARAQIRLAGEAPVEVALSLRPGVFTEEVTVVGARLVGSAEALERLPGSVDVVDRRQLEDSRVADVNEALRKASGVHARDEEGLALRPNIGIRGLNPTRSSKTLLLEDGLFVTYAPYGDNATYYHPPVERFEAIEVVKGSSQIAYGPVTVGGVVNYLTPAPPAKPTANLRLTGGNRDYFHGQALAGGTWGGTALLADTCESRETARGTTCTRSWTTPT